MEAAQCMRFGWRAFRAHAGRFVGITAALLAARFVALTAVTLSLPLPMAVGAGIASTAFFYTGMFAAARAAASGRAPGLADAFRPFARHPGQCLGVSLAFGAGLLAGGIGLLFTMFVFMFAPLLVADGLSARAALRRSARLIWARPGRCAVLTTLLLVLNLLAILPLGLGLLVTAPLSALAIVHLLQRLAADLEASTQSNRPWRGQLTGPALSGSRSRAISECGASLVEVLCVIAFIALGATAGARLLQRSVKGTADRVGEAILRFELVPGSSDTTQSMDAVAPFRWVITRVRGAAPVSCLPTRRGVIRSWASVRAGYLQHRPDHDSSAAC